MINMSAGVFSIGSIILSKTLRLTPAEFATLNSSPITAVVGILGKACLFISGSAIPYIGSTPYNEGNNLGVLDDVNFISQGQTINITNTGRSAIITQQQTSDCLTDGNGLLLFMGNDLTGGDIGYDITIIYTYVNT
jgi:hypothetical protein